MTRLARGSLPWPAGLTVEAPIYAGTRLRVTAWPRSGPDGTPWLSLELEPYPKGGRAVTATADSHSR